VHSEWGKGTNFTFLIALDESKNNADKKFCRKHNCNNKIYTKIKLKNLDILKTNR